MTTTKTKFSRLEANIFVKFGNELKLMSIKSIKVSRKQPVKLKRLKLGSKAGHCKGPLGEFSVDLPYVLGQNQR